MFEWKDLRNGRNHKQTRSCTPHYVHRGRVPKGQAVVYLRTYTQLGACQTEYPPHCFVRTCINGRCLGCWRIRLHSNLVVRSSVFSRRKYHRDVLRDHERIRRKICADCDLHRKVPPTNKKGWGMPRGWNFDEILYPLAEKTNRIIIQSRSTYIYI